MKISKCCLGISLNIFDTFHQQSQHFLLANFSKLQNCGNPTTSLLSRPNYVQRILVSCLIRIYENKYDTLNYDKRNLSDVLKAKSHVNE